MPRSSVTATSSRPSSFSAAAAAMPMPNTGAPSRRPKKIVPGLAPSFTASSTLSSTRDPSGLLPHHQRVAVDHIGAGVAVAFQREQFLVIAAQMRGAVENMGDESGLAERKRIEC